MDTGPSKGPKDHRNPPGTTTGLTTQKEEGRVHVGRPVSRTEPREEKEMCPLKKEV